jgi:hypothetical protein
VKFFIDNNLSLHLAKALAALCEPEGHVVEHKTQRFAPDVAEARGWRP